MSYEEYVKNVLEYVDDENLLEIANEITLNGLDNLEDEEIDIVNNIMEDYLLKECPICSQEIFYEDMLIAVENGKCSDCNYKYNK